MLGGGLLATTKKAAGEGGPGAGAAAGRGGSSGQRANREDVAEQRGQGRGRAHYNSAQEA